MNKKTARKKKTVSEYYGLKKTQYDLDFFDCYINKDTPLFIDPWAIRCEDDEFALNCYQKIQSVFEILITYVRTKQKDKALDLLDNLHEPSETGLGYSIKTKNGSSVGREKSENIYKALVKSKAVKSGMLNDLEDTALHIEGVGADNISDIITNIIRYELIKYTQEQCNLYQIPMIRGQTKVYWDEMKKDFIQTNDERLLVIEGKKILLVPKRILRRKLSIDYTDFYSKSIIEFEQARHYDARTSLCRTLRDKKTKKLKIVAPPYKKTLEEKEEYKLSRELVFKYIDEYPRLLEEYKKLKSDTELVAISNSDIIKKQNRNNILKKSIKEKVARFRQIKPGKEHANDYHNHILDCLNTIFNDPTNDHYLSAPKKEDKQNKGRKKIDITFHNAGNRGFFSKLSNYGNLVCAKILFECKNYNHDLENPEYDQMIGRFNNRISRIGYIVCRTINDNKKAIETCKDILLNDQGYVFVLTDEDIINMLLATQDVDRDIIIDQILQQKMNDLVAR
ncbi:MAG: hypothetical protein K0S38_9 [Candidatus Paceibacter sp.]|jgi:hypothetical protein|nr:hypothetical protein [Candidatus Paceibacter sp.]